MPKRPDFILQISVRNIEDFSPEAIVKSPRTFRPIDVQNACKNLAFTVPAGTPPIAMSLAHYAAIDFFALAHSTGLYNRQIKLWEALAKTQTIEIYQAQKGLFSSEKLPEFDIALQDHKKRTTALATFAKSQNNGDKFDYLKSTREFLKRASMVQGIQGIFICYPNPFPANVLEFVKKETNAQDTVARFESLHQKLGIPLNVLELDHATIFNPSDPEQKLHKIRLVHPDLHKKRPGPPITTADMTPLDSSEDPAL